MLKLLAAVLAFGFSCLTMGTANADVTINGTLSKWHPLTIDVTGATNPLGERLNAPNPFLDFRFDVTFTSPADETFTVPGFFAGDGKGNGIGDVWRARFSPNQAGQWSYEISFRSGKDVSVSDTAGTALPIDGTSGVFNITPQSDADDGFLKYGRLEYIGDHYLKFADGPHWIKGGIDSPENFFGYAGFDDTVDNPGGASTGTLLNGVHHYTSHIADWRNGDPLFDNSQTPEAAKGIIGAVNYLASEGVNSLYFLPMNLGGDGRETYPFIGTNDTFYVSTHYDISKLYQWNIVLNHMQNQGIAAHMVLAETEAGNSNWFDDGELGIERKLFYREMIARFSYLLALKWNLSEESRFGAERHKAFAGYIKSLDWAKHPVAVHTHLNKPEADYEPILGDSTFDASSIQFSPANANTFVETWRQRTADAGRPWVIDMDEVGSALTGLTDTNADTLRRSVLYPVYFSGGNIEWYFGYHPLPLGGDMRTEDFRTRESMYRYMRYAREMMQEQLPFWEMLPADELHSTPGAQVFAKAADTYAVYLADARQSGTLTVAPGTYRQRWFNPRSGLFEGTATTVSASSQNPDLTLGSAPNTQGQDWVILMDNQNTDSTTVSPNTEATEDSEVAAVPESESTDNENPDSEASVTETEDTSDVEAPVTAPEDTSGNETLITTTEDTANAEVPLTTTENNSPENSSNGNSGDTTEVNPSVPVSGNAQPTPTDELLATFNPGAANEQQEATSTSGNEDSGGTADLWFLLVLFTTLLAVCYTRKPGLAKNNMS